MSILQKIRLRFAIITGVNTTGIGKRNKKGESQLHVAARGGNLSRVKVLIEARADVNLRDNAGLRPFDCLSFHLNSLKYCFVLFFPLPLILILGDT
jgi:hypothetical protein